MSKIAFAFLFIAFTTSAQDKKLNTSTIDEITGLKGKLNDYWSIDVNGPWRVLFKFDAGNAYEVHIDDPH